MPVAGRLRRGGTSQRSVGMVCRHRARGARSQLWRLRPATLAARAGGPAAAGRTCKAIARRTPGAQEFPRFLTIHDHRTCVRIVVLVDDLVPMRKARVLAGVSAGTLRRWTREGRLMDRRSAGNQRVFLHEELEAAMGCPLGEPPERSVVVLYARVSSGRQASEGDLERPSERLLAWAEAHRPTAPVESCRDVASGLSDNRAGLRRALARCQAEDVGELVSPTVNLSRGSRPRPSNDCSQASGSPCASSVRTRPSPLRLSPSPCETCSWWPPASRVACTANEAQGSGHCARA